ncbi:MAG: hypothetical protein ACOH19_00845 [Rhodoglobus sp.]
MTHPSRAVNAREAIDQQRLDPADRRVIGPLLRRVPEQARSWKRVESVIAAAESLLDEHGYSELFENPTRLFRQADVPPGTFYDYFGSLETVVECVRLLWTQRIYTIIDRAYAEPCEIWHEAADRIVDSTVQFFMNFAARELWLTHQLTPTARRAELKANQATGARMRREVERLGHQFTGDERDELVLVEMSDQLVRFSFVMSRDNDPDPEFVQRAKNATRAYLATLITPAGSTIEN